MFFIPFDNWKTLFIKVYRDSEGFSKRHVVSFFEPSVLKEVRVLWKFIQIYIRTDIRGTDSYLDSYSLFQVIAHNKALFNNDSYKHSLTTP